MGAEFGARLKEIRQSRRLSQRALAKLLNVSRGAIGMYETGAREPDFDMLNEIAQVLRTSVGDLLMNEHRQLNKKSEVRLVVLVDGQPRQLPENYSRAILALLDLDQDQAAIPDNGDLGEPTMRILSASNKETK